MFIRCGLYMTATCSTELKRIFETLSGIQKLRKNESVYYNCETLSFTGWALGVVIHLFQ